MEGGGRRRRERVRREREGQEEQGGEGSIEGEMVVWGERRGFEEFE